MARMRGARPVRAPGTLESHYAPRGRVVLVERPAGPRALLPPPVTPNGSPGWRHGSGSGSWPRRTCPRRTAGPGWPRRRRAEDYARDLYAALRRADELGLATVVAVLPEARRRAAGPRGPRPPGPRRPRRVAGLVQLTGRRPNMTRGRALSAPSPSMDCQPDRLPARSDRISVRTARSMSTTFTQSRTGFFDVLQALAWLLGVLVDLSAASASRCRRRPCRPPCRSLSACRSGQGATRPRDSGAGGLLTSCLSLGLEIQLWTVESVPSQGLGAADLLVVSAPG